MAFVLNVSTHTRLLVGMDFSFRFHASVSLSVE
jgi:hypothetical protein